MPLIFPLAYFYNSLLNLSLLSYTNFVRRHPVIRLQNISPDNSLLLFSLRPATLLPNHLLLLSAVVQLPAHIVVSPSIIISGNGCVVNVTDPVIHTADHLSLLLYMWLSHFGLQMPLLPLALCSMHKNFTTRCHILPCCHPCISHCLLQSLHSVMGDTRPLLFPWIHTRDHSSLLLCRWWRAW